MAAQLASEGPRVRYTSQERSPLVETATVLQAQQEQLKAQILDLRGRIGATEQADAGSAAVVRDLNAQLLNARIAAGLIPLTGTGIVIQLDDSLQPVAANANQADYLVGARDVRRRRELWSAGAEAVAVNEADPLSTAIIDIGPSIPSTRRISRRHTRSRHWDRRALRSTGASPGFVDLIRARAQTFGIRVSFAEPESVNVPAFAGTVTLRYAHPEPGPSVAPAAVPSSGTGG